MMGWKVSTQVAPRLQKLVEAFASLHFVAELRKDHYSELKVY